MCLYSSKKPWNRYERRTGQYFYIIYKDLSQWKHVDAEQKRPEDGALWNSTFCFCTYWSVHNDLKDVQSSDTKTFGGRCSAGENFLNHVKNQLCKYFTSEEKRSTCSLDLKHSPDEFWPALETRQSYLGKLQINYLGLWKRPHYRLLVLMLL